MVEKIKANPKKTAVFVILILLLAFIVWLFLKPFQLNQEIVANPATSYEDALTRIITIQAEEEAMAEVNPVCHSKLLTHGEKTEKVVVFFHGFTSCPEQYVPLAEQFYESGYNVYIPRQPYHGMFDNMTTALEALTAEDLAAYGSSSADIAQGLGEEVIISGLSGGGSVASYVAQERADVELAAPTAPFLGVGFIPSFLTKPVTNLALMLPNFYLWWDPTTKNENPESSAWQYNRYPIHALMANLELGFVTARDGEASAPHSLAITMIGNENDRSVNNNVSLDLVNIWREHGKDEVDIYVFEKALGLEHDIISIDRSYSRPDIVYPVMLELLGAEEGE